MTSRISTFVILLIGYVLMWLFQYRISDFFYMLWMVVWSIKNVITSIGSFLGVGVPWYVYVAYWSLIFLVVYRVLHKLYLWKQK